MSQYIIKEANAFQLSSVIYDFHPVLHYLPHMSLLKARLPNYSHCVPASS